MYDLVPDATALVAAAKAWIVRGRRPVARRRAGRPLSWSARRTSAGRGPASSNLRYDQAVAPELGGAT